MNRLIILVLFLFISFSLPSVASNCQQQEVIIAEETMFVDNDEKCSKVIITNLRNIICKGNVFDIIFDCKFWSDESKAGDKVVFSLPESVFSKEGTLLIPCGAKVYGTVLKIKKQRKFNKNARVYMTFDCISFPDGRTLPMDAKPNTKDGSLMEGPWMTAGKLAASTVGLGVIGAGAGVGFSFIPNPAKIGTGLAVGIPVGASVGLITGLLTPGLKYHAKAGEKIEIILCNDLSLPKFCN